MIGFTATLIAWMNRTRDPLRGPHWLRRSWSALEDRSTWGGPTRPRPTDEPWFPKSLLYDTAEVITRYEYEQTLKTEWCGRSSFAAP